MTELFVDLIIQGSGPVGDSLTVLRHVTEGAYCFQFLTCFILKMTGCSDHFFVGGRPYYGTDLFREVLKRQFSSCVFETEKGLQI